MEASNNNDELERIAPTLHRLQGRDPFMVPDGFFDRFPHEVQAAIVAREQLRGWAALPLLARRLAIALAVAAVLAGGWWIRNNKPGTAIAQLSTTPCLDDLNWSEEHELLASLEEDLPTMEAADIRLTDDEIAAYITHENIDLTDLLTEP